MQEHEAALADEIASAGPDVASVLAAAARLGPRVPRPGVDTLARLRVFAAIAERDVSTARVVEPHLDALAILAEAGLPAGEGSWGVFAAEAPGSRLQLGPDGTLSGVKPWCSLAGALDSALVTAWVDDERRGLFAVELRRATATVTDVPWHARGLTAVVSSPVRFDRAEAVPVGEPGWYLRRPGFAWGGIGVAACWWGGARPLLQRLLERTASTSDTLALARIGRAHRAMATAAESLAAAASAIDRAATGPTDRDTESIRAHRVRGVVADAVAEVLSACQDVLGPGPAVFDAEYARRTADLALYAAQYHRGRDDASLARTLARAVAADPSAANPQLTSPAGP
ncbi:hypothetical protein HQQ81_16855 [Microbacteriaceae bacterium VKM Ac-2854]|nr:hypothetical protein [Microbacteriaceae bacterium VKM Ac-2854]